MIDAEKAHRNGLLAEMTAIFLIAAALGIAWNHKLLYNAWTGNAPAGAPAGELPQARGDAPLPLGLMQVKELYDRKEAVIVDARDEKSIAAGHIAEAVALPVGEFEARLSRFKRSVPLEYPLVVYCNGYDCHDSMELGKKLLLAGYRTVYVFEGGFPEWRDAGYPTAGGKR
jgi:rhodanese-related sulfurtransferase